MKRLGSYCFFPKLVILTLVFDFDGSQMILCLPYTIMSFSNGTNWNPINNLNVIAYIHGCYIKYFCANGLELI